MCSNAKLIKLISLLNQVCHEKIRVLAQTAGCSVKRDGLDNDLMDRIRADPYFQPVWEELEDLMDPGTFVGRAPEQVGGINSFELLKPSWPTGFFFFSVMQVVEFLEDEVKPVLSKYKDKLEGRVEFKI